MALFDIEVNFLKHKQKINKVKQINSTAQAKKSYNSQVDLINTFRKHWINSQAFKQKQKRKELVKKNSHLYNNLDREYRRANQHGDNNLSQSRTLKSQNSTRSLRSSTAMSEVDNIKKGNKRMMEKLLVVRSSLSRRQFLNEYEKAKQAKERLQMKSNSNQKRMERSLRKMNVEPSVCLPKLKAGSSAKQKDNHSGNPSEVGSVKNRSQVRSQYFSSKKPMDISKTLKPKNLSGMKKNNLSYRGKMDTSKYSSYALK